MANEEMSGLSKMTGSEKQIPWATEIADRVIKILDDTTGMVTGMAGTAEQKEKIIKDLEARKEAILNADYAGDIISLFKDINYTDNKIENWGNLKACYRISAPCTDGERKLLLK